MTRAFRRSADGQRKTPGRLQEDEPVCEGEGPARRRARAQITVEIGTGEGEHERAIWMISSKVSNHPCTPPRVQHDEHIAVEGIAHRGDAYAMTERAKDAGPT